MVFVIQNTQNRDTAAMHIKIDELIRVTGKARNILLDLEELDDKTFEALRPTMRGSPQGEVATNASAGAGQGGRRQRRPACKRKALMEGRRVSEALLQGRHGRG